MVNTQSDRDYEGLTSGNESTNKFWAPAEVVLVQRSHYFRDASFLAVKAHQRFDPNPQRNGRGSTLSNL